MRDNILINDMKNLGAGREFPLEGREWEEKGSLEGGSSCLEEA